MSEIRFEWDAFKAITNERKHGVSFDEASTAFSDDSGLLIDDPYHSVGEQRFLLLALSARLEVLVVCHTYRADDERVRIISARRASRAERAQYARGWKI